MFYYRYRSASELAIKELIYNELYFASTKECNDPFDGKVLLSFEADYEKWKRLIELAWKGYDFKEKTLVEKQFAQYMIDISPLPYDTALKKDYMKILQSIAPTVNQFIAYMLSSKFLNILNTYKPATNYFVSFSQVCNNTLMWSHYASMHHGHCLIFKEIDNRIFQCPNRKRGSIHRKTPNRFSPTMSCSLPDGFEFHDVEYNQDSTSNDAFRNFPEYVWGQPIDENTKQEIINQRVKENLIKHQCWDYEQESRLTLSTPPAWLFGEVIEYSQQERLFNYNPEQLVGIIIGARMEDCQKQRIREIIQMRMERMARHGDGQRVYFDFVLFQAVLPDNQRNVQIIPEEIFSLSQNIQRDDAKFEKQYSDWKDGWAMVIDGSSGSRKKFD